MMADAAAVRVRKRVSVLRSVRATRTLSDAGTKLERLCGSFRQERQGAATVEFAIIAPLFFLLVMGMIEYGRMVMVQQVVTNATREGARIAILESSTRSDVENNVIDYGNSSSVSILSADISITNEQGTEVLEDMSNVDAGEPVTVTVTVPFTRVSWLPSPFYLGSVNLKASTVMRREGA